MNQSWETKEIENQARLQIFNLNLILTCNRFTKEPIRELLHTNIVRTFSNTGILPGFNSHGSHDCIRRCSPQTV